MPAVLHELLPHSHYPAQHSIQNVWAPICQEWLWQIILLCASPMPVGRTPGLWSRGTNLQATEALG